jgi:hypothetical protein
MSNHHKEKMSINWNIENDYSSMVKLPKPDQILTSTGGRSKGQSFSLQTRNRENMIQPTNPHANMMSNIPELANESRLSDNHSHGGDLLWGKLYYFIKVFLYLYLKIL